MGKAVMTAPASVTAKQQIRQHANYYTAEADGGSKKLGTCEGKRVEVRVDFVAYERRIYIVPTLCAKIDAEKYSQPVRSSQIQNQRQLKQSMMAVAIQLTGTGWHSRSEIGTTLTLAGEALALLLPLRLCGRYFLDC
jgi:hypothetical protein